MARPAGRGFAEVARGVAGPLCRQGHSAQPFRSARLVLHLAQSSALAIAAATRNAGASDDLCALGIEYSNRLRRAASHIGCETPGVVWPCGYTTHRQRTSGAQAPFVIAGAAPRASHAGLSKLLEVDVRRGQERPQGQVPQAFLAGRSLDCGSHCQG
ncbi:hypothetical protein D3C76_581850 [compost metagenome]